MKIGIVGLPNVGKSTLFQALTKKQVDIADYPFTTIKPNIGVMPVPDERFEKLLKLIKPAAHFPAIIEVVDIAGLVKGAHQGKGLGNEFLSHIYGVDAVLFLIGCFKDEHNPEEQIAILKEELSLKDKKLSDLPSFVIYNTKDRQIFENAAISDLIRQAYKTLGLITFYTIKGGKEARAWAVPQGTLAPEAAGKVHTDFKTKFIKADVIPVEKLLEAGGPSTSSGQAWQQARQKGWTKTQGKEYVVNDGDVIDFKI